MEDSLYHSLLEKLQQAAATIRVGDPLSPETQMGPIVSSAQQDKVWRTSVNYDNDKDNDTDADTGFASMSTAIINCSCFSTPTAV